MKNHSSVQSFLAKFKKLSFTLLLLLGLTGLSWISSQTTVTFSYTGGAQSWIVPSCVTTIDIEALGGQCGGGQGLGGKATGSLAVTAGQVLNIYVGGDLRIFLLIIFYFVI